MAKEETRNNIMNAAMELYATKGYNETTTKMIADKANCNEVTIFRHFITKENLFSESIRHYTDKIDVSKKIPELTKMSPSVVVRFIGEDFIKHCYINKLPYKVQLKLQDDVKDIKKLQLTRRYISSFTTYLMILKEKGEFNDEPEEAATCFLLSILGEFTFYVLLNDVAESYINKLVDKNISDFIKLHNLN